MIRPGFLSNKHTTCDFCGLDFIGNINKANLFMCDRCLRYLCSATEEQKIRFLDKFRGEKDKEELIKRFINEEVLENVGETTVNQQHPFGGNDSKGLLRVAPNKIWKKPDRFKLGKAGA
jgi:hypothetical protein